MRRISQGCWICRLRRKKCSEQRPVCKECESLHISTCSYGDKPDWMDGGAKQNAMAEKLKHEVKRQAPYRHRRRTEAADDPLKASSASEPAKPHQGEGTSSPVVHDLGTTPAGVSEATTPVNPGELQRQVLQLRPFSQEDSVLLVFYLERILPFLFPFYRPPPLQGSRAWILDLVISSPVVRQAILCQSSYFFASAHAVSITTNSQMWEALLEQAREAFNTLRGSIQVVESVNDTGSVLGSVRAMAAIIQLQRFEIAISCFDNCRAHLNAALSIFRKIIDVVGAENLANSPITFQTIYSMLGAQTWILTAHQMQVPSSEQAAFRFSLALLLFDDIIASTVLQERPQLYDLHQTLLCGCDGMDNASVPCINLESLVGCQNWVLKQIAETAVLDAWKKDCQEAGNLDIMELVNRVTTIKNILETQTSHSSKPDLESAGKTNDPFLRENATAIDSFGVETVDMSRQSALVTQIWAHSAFLYLSIVVSGWQHANNDVRRHVAQAVDLLTQHGLSPAVLRTLAWPICVIGCLAESVQRDRIREMVDSLQPASRFTTVRRGFDISEKIWQDRAVSNAAEFATYFRDDGTLVLLV